MFKKIALLSFISITTLFAGDSFMQKCTEAFTSIYFHKLFNVVRNNDIEKIKYLFDHDRININIFNLSNQLLDVACTHNNYEIAEILIKHGANPNAEYPNHTLLQRACLNFNIELVNILLKMVPMPIIN